MGSVEEDTIQGKTVLACEKVTVHMGMLDSGGPLGELFRTLPLSGSSPLVFLI